MTARFAHAVVAGKFYPFHRGHRLLIETALAQSERVTVLLCVRRAELIPAALRASWIRTLVPSADLRIVDCDAEGLPEDDSEVWARFTIDLLGAAPAAVFSSEDYGDSWAAALARRAGRPVEHVRVDRERIAVPVSGSAIRARPRELVRFLDPPVARYLGPRRVVVLGAESTGKTTLARDLAGALGTVWVPEYGRAYTEALPDPAGHVWSEPDFVAIAEGQLAREDAACEAATAPVVILDTDAYVTALFCESYTGERSPAVERLAAGRCYDLYLVCDPATPFVQDATGTRRLEQRTFLHERELAYAHRSGRTTELVGDRGERLELALAAVREMLGETSLPRFAWPGWHALSDA